MGKWFKAIGRACVRFVHRKADVAEVTSLDPAVVDPRGEDAFILGYADGYTAGEKDGRKEGARDAMARVREILSCDAASELHAAACHLVLSDEPADVAIRLLTDAASARDAGFFDTPERRVLN